MAVSDFEIFPSAPVADTTLLFDNFRLVPSERALFHSERPVRITGRAFDLLLALLERPGEIISKHELIARAWPRSFVEEGNLRVHIVALRKLLGTSAEGRPFVETVAGRGYSFVAPVTKSGARPGAAAKVQLPVQHNRLIGRDDVLTELAEQACSRRLVTVVGPGGMGKTTLAVAAGHRLGACFGERVYFVDLSAAADPAQVPMALGLALGIPLAGGDAVGCALDYLRQQPALLLFDNCEHLVDEVAKLVQRLLREAPGAHVLATSREALRIDAEWVYRLSPLAVPPPNIAPELLPPEAMATFPAVQLFIERASAGAGGLALDPAGLASVVDICRRLDGIPLAIELAAGRAGLLGLHGLADHLEDCFSVLTGGCRTALPRHQTLRATLDWSHDMLSERDRTVFRRLSLFRAPFRLECAIEVVHCERFPRAEVLESIANLVAKSLLAVEVNGDPACYRLLSTTAAYAYEKLVESGELRTVGLRYTTELIAILEQANGERGQMPAADWLTLYGRFIEHIASGLDWAFAPGGNIRLGQRLCAVSAPWWHQLSLVEEYRGRLAQALAPGLPEDPCLELLLQLALGDTLVHVGGAAYAPRQAAYLRALELAQLGEDVTLRLRALSGCYSDAICAGDYHAALDYAECYGMEGAGLDSELAAVNHASLLARAQHYLGMQADARSLAEFLSNHPLNAVPPPLPPEHQLLSRLGNQALLARTLWLQGYPDQAMRVAREALAEAERMDHGISHCYALQLICTLSAWRGERAAVTHYAAVLQQVSRRCVMPKWEFWTVAFQAAQRCHDHGECARDSLPVLTQNPCCGDWHIDVLATLHPALLTPRAIARAEQCLAGWCEAEVLRAWGESLLRAGAHARAEELFLRALRIAQAQQVPAWELRVACSLARLWRATPRAGEGLSLLRAVHERFTEGHGTADLRAAAALLAG
ncbi:ATP-binding protein [Pseudoduganella sp. UC29_106]|uniref:ATP-binding protein n=1 Tax=Pseudoduganella sp. UC29_106 TaxID=3374553 RepID=UPI00375801B6